LPGRAFLLAGLLVASIALPYAILGDGLSNLASTNLLAVGDGEDAQDVSTTWDASQPLTDAANAPAGIAANQPPSLALQPANQLTDVVRFDVTPGWVTSRWKRVSTTLAETDLYGLRVPLVTGTEPHDVAGSLTYYFDKTGQAQRITFDGVVGDERQLVATAIQVFHLKPEPAAGTGLYLAKWNRVPRSVLQLRYSPVVHSSDRQAKLEVYLEINRPAKKYGLSRRGHQLVQQQERVGGW